MKGTTRQEELRKIPSVEEILQWGEITPWIDAMSRPIVTRTIRDVLGEVRKDVSGGAPCPDWPKLLDSLKQSLKARERTMLRPVINATGVVLHTNLGRAPISASALREAVDIAGGYCNLEIELSTGKRGRRASFVEELVCILTGAEAALVVNNNAAALLLALSALAQGKEVIISRGELVQIGGGFRIPDVIVQGGARLREVGTTNQTTVADYEDAVGPDTAMLVKVHHSNFRMTGFTRQPDRRELAALALRHGLALVEDLGSGAMTDTAVFGLEHEPTPAESLASGVHLVCFSGDKLMGGPQSGILAGKKEIVDRLRRHPLLRALRIDKVQAALLQAVLLEYLKGEATNIPIIQMLGAGPDEIRERAEKVAATISAGGVAARVEPCVSAVGGGSMPGQEQPSCGVAITPACPVNRAEERLRTGILPVLARIEGDRLILDLRTVFPHQDIILSRSALAACLA